MEWTPFHVLSFIVFVVSLLLVVRRKGSESRRRRPPGPPGWPVFGNLFNIGQQPHRKLATLREKYGPIIWLRLGSIDTMVLNSAKVATEFFKNHDLEFAERTVTDLMRSHGYADGSVALAPYGPYWRVMRRLVTVDMLVTKRLVESAPIRRKCVDDMITWIGEAAKELRDDGEGICLARYVFFMTFNLLGNLMMSKDMFDPKSEVGSEFFKAMTGLMEWSGHPNVAELFPWLRKLDPQGLKRRMDRDMGKAMEIASGLVRERMKEREMGVKKRDFLDVLMEFRGNGRDEPDIIPEKELNIFILEIFLAGSETTSSTMEWALTELLLNPHSMAKVKDELDHVIGPGRKVEESDIDNLLYLQAVLKETFRLHPPIPFLVPRRAMKDTTFMGYDVPENTQVFVNAWAIGRDPDVWDDPLAFRPERFIGSKVDYKGQHFEFIPFGAGRRMCAGVPLAHRVIHLTLSSLIHEFDWEFDRRIDSKNIDLRDRLGITMRKYEPLLAVPKKRRL
ncbi:hypothetical protein MLD38_032516 [Melastoma candidum]|uniref:Uncharacterized protein n=1 Tax=Melastoma candidum TaxID=119954 RepID=A0ACB9M5V5_9MYRT|nr:hypothetical protein MLD38_032516 [Melastoma candidum]